ncbi:MAG: hypothetical protein E3K40_04245 [Candidatus Brocadia sp.]|nr:hypothetical protein [Candidatus Brocadia sp.]
MARPLVATKFEIRISKHETISKYLERKGLLEPPYYFNVLFGNIACAQADLLHVGVMLKYLPAQSYWSLGGIGDAQ